MPRKNSFTLSFTFVHIQFTPTRNFVNEDQTLVFEGRNHCHRHPHPQNLRGYVFACYVRHSMFSVRCWMFDVLDSWRGGNMDHPVHLVHPVKTGLYANVLRYQFWNRILSNFPIKRHISASFPPSFLVASPIHKKCVQEEEGRRSDSHYRAASHMAAESLVRFTQGVALPESRLPWAKYMSPRWGFRLVAMPTVGIAVRWLAQLSHRKRVGDD